MDTYTLHVARDKDTGETKLTREVNGRVTEFDFVAAEDGPLGGHTEVDAAAMLANFVDDLLGQSGVTLGLFDASSERVRESV